MNDRVLVVGGGLAGLIAANLLARAGLSPLLLERSRRLGGRADTQRREGRAHNLGPHALYRGGRLSAILARLGCSPAGGVVPTSGILGLRGEELFTLPTDPRSLLGTDLVPSAERPALVAAFARLAVASPRAWAARSVDALLDWATDRPRIREILAALVRVATYAGDHATASAELALRQARLAARGVVYVDDGWGTIVEALATTARAAGAELREGARVSEILVDGAVRGARLEDGTELKASAVILSGAPQDIEALTSLRFDVEPIRAACLDLVLDRLPRPERRVALGLDRRSYLSVHSAHARLVEPGRHLVSLAKYLVPGDDPELDRAELLAMMDTVQPGWRDALLDERYLPRLTVTHALPRAADRGLAGRPAVETAIDGLHLAGDWIGADGHLADASAASAERAARAILARARKAA